MPQQQPTTAPRPLTPAATRILDTAAGLFYSRGIQAVGVDLIAEQAGTTKKTLYDRFGSKGELVAQYLRRRDLRWRAHVEATLERGRRRSPARRPLLVFDALADWIERENPRGCAFVNAHAELADAGHPGRQAIAEQKQWVLDLLRELTAAAGVRRPAAVADSLLILLEGATVASTVGVVPDAVANAKRLASRVLADAAG